MDMADTVEHRFGRFSWRLPREYEAGHGTYRVRKVDIIEVPEAEGSGAGGRERLWAARREQAERMSRPEFPKDEGFLETVEVLPGVPGLYYGHLRTDDHHIDVLWSQEEWHVWFSAPVYENERDVALARLREVIPAYRAAGVQARLAVDQRMNFVTGRGYVALPYGPRIEDEERVSVNFQSRAAVRRLRFKFNALEQPLDPDAEDPVHRACRMFSRWSGSVDGADLVRNDWTEVLGLRGAETDVVEKLGLYPEWRFERRRSGEPQILVRIEGEFEDHLGSSEQIKNWDHLLCQLHGVQL